MKLDTHAVLLAIAESQLTTKEILSKAKITPRTWFRARKGGTLRPQTAWRISRALGVPLEKLMAKDQ